jgi:hypothetical protein
MLAQDAPAAEDLPVLVYHAETDRLLVEVAADEVHVRLLELDHG